MDAALIVTISIWAVNFSVVKFTLGHLPPLAFNTIRLTGASICFFCLARLRPGPSILPGDWKRLLLLGLTGHTAYQLLFIFGIHATTASNTAILLGLTPVFVALLSRGLSAERQGIFGWLGIATSFFGAYLVLRDTAKLGGSHLGDGLALLATFCWSLHTVLSQPLVARYGPLRTSAYALSLGTLFFLPIGLPSLFRVDFAALPASALAGTLFSMLFALVIAYFLWYYGVSRLGPTQTAIYNNLTPVAALVVAYLTLGEPVGRHQLVGALVIFAGIYLVRRQRPQRSVSSLPEEPATAPTRT